MADRTPVLVGIAQLLQRVEDPQEASSPLELMLSAVHAAGQDAEAPGLLDEASSIRVIQGIWGYRNPAAALSEELGLGPVETGLSVLGGNHVQMVLSRTALDIQAGRHDVVVLTGAECGRTLGRARKAGLEIDWLEKKKGDPAPAPDVVYGTEKWTRHEAEMALGIQRPVHYYAIFEIALRHRAGRSPDEHLRHVSEVWSRFSDVAQGNPHAWIREPVSAVEIRTVSPNNRMIAYPYPMLMNANMRVDMGAALLLCSEERADALGVPRARRVYPLSGTDAYDHYFVSERDELDASPAIRLAGARAVELAGVELGDLDHVDLYSCFPSAVQVAARELGLETDRPLTVTGGLTFGGGPLNNYVMHSIARTAELLRQTPNGRALVTANGGMLTKHSFGVYGSEPPEEGFRHADLQDEVDALPRRELAASVRGDAEIEAYTVAFGGPPARPTTSYTSIYGRATSTDSEPSVAHLACRLPDGRRCWANVGDPEVLDVLCRKDLCGQPVRLDGEGGASLL